MWCDGGGGAGCGRGGGKGGVRVVAMAGCGGVVAARGGAWWWGSGRSGDGEAFGTRPENSSEKFSGGG
ncbi:hypothetical protein Tco_0143519 [Tanacetum coccineum]